MKQTAVEWLIEQWPILESQIPERILEQAKEMEKEQIIEAYIQGSISLTSKNDAEQYYKETYESKTNL
jgi:HEPN domain-containing protein